MDALRVALIADDDEFFRIALNAILKSKLGFTEVVEAGSLDEAIERLSDRDDVSLALFDLAMPGMESAVSLGAVRDVHPDLKVAVVSGSSRRADILTALTAGVHGYVPKGLGATELAAAIKAILNGAIYVPPSVAGRTPYSVETVATPVAKGGGRGQSRHRIPYASATRGPLAPDRRLFQQGNCPQASPRRRNREDSHGGPFPQPTGKEPAGSRGGWSTPAAHGWKIARR